MAESNRNSKLNAQDNFADDLDSMLNFDESADEQIGFLDDDDAIDRLLLGDSFQEQEDSDDSISNIDELLAETLVSNDKANQDFDEFGEDIDDLIANTQLNPKADKLAQANILPPDLNTDEGLDNEIGFSELESVEFNDELTADDSILPELETTSLPANEDLENMTEIDVFSDPPTANSPDKEDFLLADFDISTDDDLEPVESTELSDTETFSPTPNAITEQDLLDTIVESEIEQTDTNSNLSDEFDPEIPTTELSTETSLNPPDSEPTSSTEPEAGPDTLNKQLLIELGAAVSALTVQVNDLKQQQLDFVQALTSKTTQGELNECLESIDTLRTEQKKTKRNLDAVTTKKPVSAYIANGIAIIALIVGGSLGYQGYSAKSQVNQLITVMEKFQAQLAAIPTLDGDEKEMLRNQLDELARSASVNAEQIAELTKNMLGEPVSGANGDSKQLSEIINQNMQIGAIIETLQAKVANLEKAKSLTAAKPAPKKPVIIEDNWEVNLVAFKQDWYARRKAEEFTAKGIPTKVNKSVSKGETWYRLSVDGFKTQYEAAAYAARVKKTLNLDSVWVSKNKK